MKKRPKKQTKKNVGWMVSILFLLSLHLFAFTFTQNTVEQLKARLPEVSGLEKVNVLKDLMKALGTNTPRQVIEYGQQALKQLEITPDHSLELSILNDICWNYHILGDYKKALAYADKGIKIAEAFDLKDELSRFYNKIGVICWKSSDYDRALEYHRKAIKINKEGFKKELTHSYNNIALVYMELGEYETALNYLLKAMGIPEEFNEKLPISQALLNNIGWVHHNLKNYQKALEFYSRCLKLKEVLGEKHGRANVLTDMGDTYQELKDHTRALECYGTARKLYEELEAKRGIAKTLNKIGFIYNNLKQYRSALGYYSRSLKINEKLGDKQAIAESILNTTRTYKNLGRYREALVQANRALTMVEEIKAKRLIGETLEEIAGIYTGMKEFNNALVYYKKYKENNDSIYNEETGKKIAEMQIKYESDKKQKEIELLKKSKEFQDLELAKQGNIKNFLIAVCGLIFLLAVVIYYSYRLKARSTLKLKESEEKFRILAEKSYNGIYIIRDDRFKYVNPKFAEIFGYRVEEILDKKHLPDLIFENDWEMEKQIMQRKMSGEVDFLSSKFRGIRKDGEIISIESFGSPIIFQGQKAFLGGILDITDRKRAEVEQLKNRNLESIGVLAGGIAHDFNNLLSVILGSISMVKEDLSPGNEHFAMLDRADQATMQAANLAGKLLTFSHGDVLIREKVKLPEVLQQAMAIKLPGSQHSFQLDVPGSLKPIYGDKRQLAQVFSNLIQNAGDAMPEGGTISIYAENPTLDATSEWGLKAGKYVHISVEDTGIGIPGKSLGKIFDPYFSTKGKSTQKGMGMGLTVCYSIIRKHNGHIMLTSEEGKGTVVDLYLPAFEVETPIKKKEKEVVPLPGKEKPAAKQKVRLLFMDDEESVITINRDMLKKMGFEVTCFSEGAEAVKMYKQAKNTGNPFDIVILDIINYIGMGGSEALQQILEFDPRVKSIAISGYLRDTDIDDLKKIGFNEVILKPYTPNQLKKAINKLLSRN